MAWETRGRTRYFYRSRRVGKTIRKVYLGSGDVAKQAAAKDAAAKAQRVTNQAALAEFQTRLAGVDQLAADVDQGVHLLTEAVLLTMGFREHRGEWRLSRD
jgi:hypothetical protein